LICDSIKCSDIDNSVRISRAYGIGRVAIKIKLNCDVIRVETGIFFIENLTTNYVRSLSTKERE
jgi:hypothetical protein